MEDMWEGITSLSDNNSSSSTNHTITTTKGAKFQDFLAQPFAPSSSPPITVLSLSTTRSEFHFDPLTHKGLQLAQPHHNSASKVETFPNPFCNSLPSFSNKSTLRPGTTPVDQRNMRLMKNRESAARSRARKQAYVFELKQKSKQLQDENERLRKQLQLLRETEANKGKRGNLYRTYTAPF